MIQFLNGNQKMNKLIEGIKFFAYGIIFLGAFLTFQQVKPFFPYMYIRGMYLTTQSLNYSQDQCIKKVYQMMAKAYPDTIDEMMQRKLSEQMEFQCVGNIHNTKHNPYMAIACMHSVHWHE